MFSVQTADRLIVGTVTNQLENLAADKAELLRRWMAERKADIAVVAGSSVLRGLDPQQIAPYLRLVENQYRVYNRFVVIGGNGRTLFDSAAGPSRRRSGTIRDHRSDGARVVVRGGSRPRDLRVARQLVCGAAGSGVPHRGSHSRPGRQGGRRGLCHGEHPGDHCPGPGAFARRDGRVLPGRPGWDVSGPQAAGADSQGEYRPVGELHQPVRRRRIRADLHGLPRDPGVGGVPAGGGYAVVHRRRAGPRRGVCRLVPDGVAHPDCRRADGVVRHRPVVAPGVQRHVADPRAQRGGGRAFARRFRAGLDGRSAAPDGRDRDLGRRVPPHGGPALGPAHAAPTADRHHRGPIAQLRGQAAEDARSGGPVRAAGSPGPAGCRRGPRNPHPAGFLEAVSPVAPRRPRVSSGPGGGFRRRHASNPADRGHDQPFPQFRAASGAVPGRRRFRRDSSTTPCSWFSPGRTSRRWRS